MASSTIFKNFSIPIEKKSLIIIANEIASDKYKPQVEKVRALISEGRIEEAQEVKKQIVAFTPSAVFTKKRLARYIEMYSGFIHLDFDKLTAEQLEAAKKTIAAIPYTFLCFVSPSGRGLKVFVEVTTGVEHHSIAYLQVQHYYEKATGLKSDPTCKDITRLCFMSHDPHLTKNIQNPKFNVVIPNLPEDNSVKPITQPTKTIQDDPQQPEDLKATFIFNQQIQFTNQKNSYHNGNRNNYVYLLASNCNRAGLPQSLACTLIAQNFDLSDREIQTAVNSAYIHHTHEHKKFEPRQFHQKKELSEEVMPTLPDAIFNSIPEFLTKVTNVATTNEERDILLLGSLVTLSVAFPKLMGRYGDNPVNANLFLFISAKASAGKGILIHCRKLILPIHLALREQARLLKLKYEVELQDYNANKGNNPHAEKPEKPPQKMLFIPANNSSTGFFELLNDSGGRGIIFETEADTLSKSFKSEHGNFSDGLRNAFQHEPHSYYRRTDKELVEIPRPCLSVMLSGTPKQIQIPNSQCRKWIV